MVEEPELYGLCDPCSQGDHELCKQESCLCIDMEHDIDPWAGEVEG